MSRYIDYYHRRRRLRHRGGRRRCCRHYSRLLQDTRQVHYVTLIGLARKSGICDALQLEGCPTSRQSARL